MLNEHFSTVGKKMAMKFNNPTTDPWNYICCDITASLFMTPTSKDEILKLIDKLDPKKSAG